jgi:hypothetical protein
MKRCRRYPNLSSTRSRMPTGASNSNNGADSSSTEPLDEQECGEILQTLSAVEGECVLLCWPRIGLSTHLEYSQIDISFGDVLNKSESTHLAVFMCSGVVHGRAGTVHRFPIWFHCRLPLCQAVSMRVSVQALTLITATCCDR